MKITIVEDKPKASNELQSLRKQICISCEHFNNETCALCGCFINQKIFYEDSHCPASKW